MPNNSEKFIQENSPDGGFLQSEEWRKFQEAVGRKTFHLEQASFWANVVEHKLPIVGSYFYIPRGPIISTDVERNSNFEFKISKLNQNSKFKIQNYLNGLIDLAKKENAGWIRIEPNNSRILDVIRENRRVVKAPHDMQPREVFIIDITKTEEELLAEMKAKTRYNIKLAQKQGIKISNFNPPAGGQISNQIQNPNDQNSNKKYLDDFLRLTKITAGRQGITVHPDEYYRKMLETIPDYILKLYVAEFEGKIIAANIVIHYGNTATYLHGASDDKYKNLMSPYLLQWQAIQDAKVMGCEKYDFGGVSTNYELSTNIRITNKWQGITRFKTGFSPKTESTEFLGSYDIIVNPAKYWLYRIIQRIKSFVR